MARRVHWAIKNRHVDKEAPEGGPVCEDNEVDEPSFEPLNECSSYHGIVLAHLEIEEGLIGRVPQLAHLDITPHVEEVLSKQCGICNEEKVIDKV